MNYTCPTGRCRSLEPFATDHVCYRLDRKGVGSATKGAAAPPLTLLFTWSDQACVDNHGEVVRLAELAVRCPLPMLVNHQPELRLGTWTEGWVHRADGAPIGLGLAEVGTGEMEDEARRELLAGTFPFLSISIGLAKLRREGAIVESAHATEVSLVRQGSCPTAKLLCAAESIIKADVAEALRPWRTWRAKLLEDRPRGQVGTGATTRSPR